MSPARDAGEPGWQCPTLAVTTTVAECLTPGSMLALRDPEGVMLAGVRVSHLEQVQGTWHVSGDVHGIEPRIAHVIGADDEDLCSRSLSTKRGELAKGNSGRSQCEHQGCDEESSDFRGYLPVRHIHAFRVFFLSLSRDRPDRTRGMA